MKPEETYLQNLRTIERIARSVARKYHVNADEADEFTQEVCVRLIEDDYAVLRKFEDRSSLSTYLTTVILRLYHQWRVEQWGKWRPSAEAKRLGDKAIMLERLMTRDGYSFSEAVRILTTPAGSQYTEAELESIYVRLPTRTPRPVAVSDEVLPESVAAENDTDDRIEARDRERAARQAATAIDSLLSEFDAEDRLLLQLRFWDSLKVPDIARTLQLEQKKIYKRLDKLFVALRRALERAGVSKTDVAALLARGDQEIHIRFLSSTEIGPQSPSHPRGSENARGREGRLR
ncbi:MAG: sigma-70 family RNA polymerase sigma factor [Acidobacteriota bacterium]|nr:sigma-70 family RNA polymerase sigma factor [Acidobacteriota bacterium]